MRAVKEEAVVVKIVVTIFQHTYTWTAKKGDKVLPIEVLFHVSKYVGYRGLVRWYLLDQDEDLKEILLQCKVKDRRRLRRILLDLLADRLGVNRKGLKLFRRSS